MKTNHAVYIVKVLGYIYSVHRAYLHCKCASTVQDCLYVKTEHRCIIGIEYFTLFALPKHTIAFASIFATVSIQLNAGSILGYTPPFTS